MEAYKQKWEEEITARAAAADIHQCTDADVIEGYLLKYSRGDSTPKPEEEEVASFPFSPDNIYIPSQLGMAVMSNAKDGRYVELAFEINKEHSLNNIFKESKDLITDPVFSIDDDITFSCSSVEFAFSVWQSAPATMMGCVPRIHLINRSACLWYISFFIIFAESEHNSYIYGGWWTGTYSMILSRHPCVCRLTKCSHHSWNMNCEDIAMSFLVANATGASPIWAKAKIYEIRSTGISSLEGDSSKRTECVNRLVSELGRMPLVNVKAVDSRGTWFW
uniref:glycosylinositol phosphorylceramide mannosyl transferase 1-like n=1 Tax=Erigeron canadensis TaxID=72917 RepID=UPI001CB8EA29|nr:glycosylinositol phosphorylceramide mannosyl transferase 1-like [Erigeron canadensis]